MNRLVKGFLLVAALTVTVSAVASAQAMRSGFNANSLAANDDYWVEPDVAFGFSINFFGTTYTSGWLNNNGNMTFTGPLGTFTPFAITGGSMPMIAAFFADVDTRAGPLMQYGQEMLGVRKAFGMTWDGVCYYAYHCDKTNAFQLVLVDRSDIAAGDFDIEFNYNRILWEAGDASSAAGGLCNGTPDYPAAAGFTNGAGSYYQLPGSLTCGAFLNGGPNSLVAGSFGESFDNPGGMEGRYVFRVRNGTPDTVVPEPMTIALLGTGLVGVAVARRRKKDDTEV